MNTQPTQRLTLPNKAEAAPEMTEAERIRRGLLADGRPRKPGYGRQEQKLAWPEIPGYRLYWANDEPGRIQELLDKGYVHVEKDGKPVERIVGKGQMGGGLNAYLLKIPVEWYNEDVLRSQESEDEKLRRIREGKLISNDPNQYVDQSRTKISSGTDRR